MAEVNNISYMNNLYFLQNINHDNNTVSYQINRKTYESGGITGHTHIGNIVYIKQWEVIQILNFSLKDLKEAITFMETLPENGRDNYHFKINTQDGFYHIIKGGTGLVAKVGRAEDAEKICNFLNI